MVWTNPSPVELAADWRAMVLDDLDEKTGCLAQFLSSDFPESEPDLTWDTTLLVVRSYNEADFFAKHKTEAQKVCGQLAAGPIEDLLSFHGERFIEKLEDEARQDRRMAWMLGGVWQDQMPDEIWNRVQGAADRSYWKRTVSD